MATAQMNNCALIGTICAKTSASLGNLFCWLDSQGPATGVRAACGLAGFEIPYNNYDAMERLDSFFGTEVGGAGCCSISTWSESCSSYGLSRHGSSRVKLI